MKTKFSLRNRRNFFAVISYIVLFLFPAQIFSQTGTSCANAINLSSDDTCFSATSSGTAFWYKFTADTSALHISLDNTHANGNDSIITQIILYGGSCSSLTGMDTSLFDPSADLMLKAADLTAGNTYFLKLIQPNGKPSAYNLCLKKGYTDIAFCSGCPSSLYNSSSYCELVCNGDFEYYTAAPTDLAQITNACPWYRSNGSSDYFNTNHTVSPQGADPGVPSNSAGSQSSCQGGQGYAGFFTYVDPSFPNVGPNYREYVIQKFISPMIAGKTYNISFNVSLSDYSAYASKGVGFWITSFSPSQIGTSSLNITPTFGSTGYITDASAWTPFTYSYTASGGEQWITFGQFTTNTGSATHVGSAITPPANNAGPYVAYYYLDKVSILPANVTSVTAAPAGVCPGESTSLSAIVPVGTTGNTYSWTPSLQVSPANTQNTTGYPSGSGTWFVCHTNAGYGGCVEADSVFVNVSPAAPPVNAGSDITICKGQSATLTGTGTSNGYGWAVLNGAVLCSLCTSTTVTPTVTTSYVYHDTNTHGGCSSYDTVKVIVNPIPAIHIVSPGGLATCDPNSFVFTTTPSGSYTYSWTTDATTYSGQTTSTLTAAWGTYTGNGYATVHVTDANGCQGKDSIVVPACCKLGASNLINTNTTSNSTLFPTVGTYQQATNTSFNLSGTFTVNANTRFKRCTVYLAPNAKIVVAAGYKLELDSSFFYACSDMWDGMYVDGTNSASEIRIIHKSVVEDAKNAIVSSHGGNFTIDGSSGRVKMNKNYIAVYVKPYQGTHPGTIRSTIISCDSPTQPGGSSFTSSGNNCKAPISARAFAAIFIDSCSNIIIGDSTQNSYRNLLERERDGIYIKNSTVKIWNNDLKYMTQITFNHQNSPTDGIAIYARGNSTLTRTLTVGRIGNYKAHNMIRKCAYGVMAENAMNLNCEYNRIDSVSGTSVYALNDLNKTILINKDSITEFLGTGIECMDITGSSITITNNQLNETTISSPSSFAYTGILVGNSTHNFFAAAPILIQNNVVKRIRNGIWISQISKAKVFDNAVTFYTGQTLSTAFPGMGVRLEEAHSAHVRNNSISYNASGIMSSTLYDHLFGINIVSSINDTITKNTIKKCGSGIFLKGNETPLLLGCNKMDSCYYGVNFGYSNSTQTSVTTSDEFRWGNPYSGTATPTGNTWVHSASGTDLKGQISPTAINWWCNSTNIPITTGMFALSLTGNAPITIGTADKCSILLSPVAPVSATNMRSALLEGICKTPRTYDTLSSQYLYHDSVFAYRTLRENPSWKSLGTGDDSYYNNFYNNVSSTNIGTLADIEDSIHLRSGLASAISTLTDLVPHSTPEANRKTVLQIYLVTWAVDSMNFDSTQSATLLAVANQAPISGGSAVFDARNMLFLEVHDSSALRLAHGVPNENVSALHIYPNPSTGALMFNYELPEEQSGSMQLYDITGRMIHSYPLASGTQVQQFDASDLPSGLYFCIVLVNNQAILNDKLILIKE